MPSTTNYEGEESLIGRSELLVFVFLMPIQKPLHVVTGHRAGCCAVSGREREIIYYNWTGRHFLYCDLLLLMYALHLLIQCRVLKNSLCCNQSSGGSLRSYHIDGWIQPAVMTWMGTELLLKPVCYYWWNKCHRAQFCALKWTNLLRAGLCIQFLCCLLVRRCQETAAVQEWFKPGEFVMYKWCNPPWPLVWEMWILKMHERWISLGETVGQHFSLSFSEEVLCYVHTVALLC